MKINNKKISSRPSSAAWVRRQLRDPYVERAKREGFRARAAYKLSGLDEKFHILRDGQTVVDLGAAPGSWSQYLRKTFPKSRVIAMDLLPIDPIEGVEFFQGDFTSRKAIEWLDKTIPGRRAAPPPKYGNADQQVTKNPKPGMADVILSDMAPNTTGHQKTDHLRQAALVEYAFDFANSALKHGGAFVAKSFAGGTTPDLLKEIKRRFETVRHVKPAASRKESVEMFIVATGFKSSGAASES